MNRWLIIPVMFITVFVLSIFSMNEDKEQENGNGVQSRNASENIEDAIDANSTAAEVPVSLKNTDGEIVATATLTESNDGVKITLEGKNLPPGVHGFHIHEVGLCETPDFKSAGAHYNPTGAHHGFKDPLGPHAGDLKNIEVMEDGTVKIEVLADMVTLNPQGKNTLLTEQGTALMIHEKADDYISQPAGDAGERIACGVIGEKL
ncbi:superoxide dismutase family protein [Oceanobacillus sp. 143]|uniref:Superoxide dismutase [Cu-Zn] n=1 Tax=Oceanobacillus zhaokaii TaxID=2052660 RepID=A0A345PL56_9BACI|nr:superoxide dismutase family protein [Oceanobacillus zhaokaii]AXI10736.1 superoxide dismutase family protein [Oceanobacillus zhaokaii]QGS69662.1 superoxide dismutase family protein [Oceanobacillus sp. 143]